MIGSVKINLTLEQWYYVKYKAILRQRAKLNGTSKIFSDYSDLDITIYGMAAEYAFGLMIGKYPNFDATINGDGGIDFTLDNGMTIDVKYRSQRNRDFALNTDNIDDFIADIGVLIWSCGKRCFEFVGWIDRETFAHEAKVMKLKGWRLVYPYQKLNNPELLYEISD